MAACRSLWWAPWTLVDARRRPSIMVVGSHGPLSEVERGHHHCASMVVLGTCGSWWVVVAVSRSSWWVLMANVDGSGGCDQRVVVTCDIVFVTSVQMCRYFLYSATLCHSGIPDVPVLMSSDVLLQEIFKRVCDYCPNSPMIIRRFHFSIIRKVSKRKKHLTGGMCTFPHKNCL